MSDEDGVSVEYFEHQIAQFTDDIAVLKQKREELRKKMLDGDAALVNNTRTVSANASLWTAPIASITTQENKHTLAFVPRLLPGLNSLDGFVGGHLWLILLAPPSPSPAPTACEGTQQVSLAPGHVGNYVPLPGRLGSLSEFADPRQFNATVYNGDILHTEPTRTVEGSIHLVPVKLVAIDLAKGVLEVEGVLPADSALLDLKIYHPDVEAGKGK
ncbi:hypothetical protein J8273_3616 [Carpediemonas membranifera]|uniref:Uncharacterized protein n=1 Tax=Carpediemonas membranifera TaxID=201153 RepID=A0A8J6E1U0_9EUKA|nr:hypothetical protein J8273_3616 [Carpediemonas membranifera]|eukprot:KAG9393476.1 hypothetical protein J8273_3616 [Carpediemonas membranifera]